MAKTSPDTATTPDISALVLGGGGSLGRSFHWGLTAGFLDAGLDLRDADRIIGTSAGAVIGVRLALGIDPRSSLPDIDPPSSAPPEGVASAFRQLIEAAARASQSDHPEEEWKTVGQMALSAQTPDEVTSLSRKTLADLAGTPWPANFSATSVDAATGQLQLWTMESGVPLERGVASSGALPGVWPPVTIAGASYVDGGVRSMLNADLARGASRVVAISCFDLSARAGVPEAFRLINDAVLGEIERLRADGAAVALITPGEAFLELSGYGTKMLDGSLVPAAYELSKAQALLELDRVREVWCS